MALKTVLQEIKHFIIHLRIIYQLVLLSGGYLLAGLFVQEIDSDNQLQNVFVAQHDSDKAGEFIHFYLSGNLSGESCRKRRALLQRTM